jgi:hypothetical protein
MGCLPTLYGIVASRGHWTEARLDEAALDGRVARERRSAAFVGRGRTAAQYSSGRRCTTWWCSSKITLNSIFLRFL